MDVAQLTGPNRARIAHNAYERHTCAATAHLVEVLEGLVMGACLLPLRCFPHQDDVSPRAWAR